MKHSIRTVILLGSLIAGAAVAEEDGAVLSYAGKDPDSKMAEAALSMQDWATGEYEEHKTEGLFQKYPQDGQLILDMLAVSREMQSKADAAKKANDMAKARAYYFSAEATAHYAARMPHLLESRVSKE
jgi:hypothetical protein